MKLNILIHAPELTTLGGKQGLFSALKDHYSHDVDFFTYGNRGKKESRLNTFWRMLRDYRRFYGQLGGNRYDVLHLNPSMNPKSFFRDSVFMFLARLRKQRTVIFWHGWDWSFFSKVKGKFRRLFRSTYGKADGMIVLASDVGQNLKDMGFKMPLFQKTTTLDSNLPLGLDEDKIAARYSSGKPLNLLFLARVEIPKGIYECLEAYESLKRKYPDIRLTIAGDGTAYDDVVKLIADRKLQDIEMLGFISGEEKKQAFHNADLYLFPSYAEGLPVSLLEAMSCGLPIVTSYVGGIRDVFQEGLMGVSMPPKDAAALEQKVEELFSDPQRMKEIALYNYRFANDKFSASKVAKSLESVYEEISD